MSLQILQKVSMISNGIWGYLIKLSSELLREETISTSCLITSSSIIDRVAESETNQEGLKGKKYQCKQLRKRLRHLRKLNLQEKRQLPRLKIFSFSLHLLKVNVKSIFLFQLNLNTQCHSKRLSRSRRNYSIKLYLLPDLIDY